MESSLSSPTHVLPTSLRKWLFRFGLVIMALAINIGMFGLMPFLLTRTASVPSQVPMALPINVIRLKQPESEVQRIKEKPPEPPPKPRAEKPAPQKPLQAKLTLPFDVNPRLPAAPGALTVPVVPPPQFDDLTDVFSINDLDSPLVVLVRIPPVYPMSAKSRGTEGWVRVRFVVNEDGSVGSISVEESEPKNIFNDAVIRSVSGWRFKTGTIGGVPVKTWAETTVRFKLD
ncbi:MAG: energy transducer TonB [Desulfopila sp.]